MIAQLSGKFLYKSPTKLIVEVAGVGYEVHISLNTFSTIQHLEQGTLLTYLKVAEDAFTLFGFAENAEKELFIKLLSVSGVGASTARMVLSSLKPVELIQVISTGQVRILEGVKGIGKKTAERLVLELRDKVSNISGSAAPLPESNTNNTPAKDALEALIALGIARNAAELAIKKVSTGENQNLSTEDLIKMALKAI